MIHLSGRPFDHNDLWPVGSIERKIVQGMIDDTLIHSYETIDELRFELALRKNIIASARALNESGAEFEIFSTARCNPQYWTLTETGGFKLKENALPSEAIQDIFDNGSLYGFECATAKVIVLYHAVLTTIGQKAFDHYFQDLYLYSWHYDPDLGLRTVDTNHFLPGDIIYFNNPDFNPSTSWWRGENAVLLDDGMFFGHGIGIMTSEEIISHLNKMRKPESNVSAYQLNSAARPSFKQLAKLSIVEERFLANKIPHMAICHNQDSISFGRYLRLLKTAYIQLHHLPLSPFV